MMSSLMIIDDDNDKKDQIMMMTMTMTRIRMKMKMMIFIRKLAVHAPGDCFPLERGAKGRHLWTCLSTEFTRGDEDKEDDDDDDDDVDDVIKYTSRIQFVCPCVFLFLTAALYAIMHHLLVQ